MPIHFFELFLTETKEEKAFFKFFLGIAFAIKSLHKETIYCSLIKKAK
jgi:hypothetical protein